MLARMQGVRARVTGRVQGVGFRYYVQRLADELGLAGEVRNLPDGSVEAEAAGERPALERFVAGLGDGPRHARVDEVEVEWRPAARATGGFHIRG